MRRLLAVVAATLPLFAPAAARAVTVTPLAPVAGSAPISAYGGYVVWSEQGADGLWHLVRFHDGVKETMSAVAPRSVPFDVDAGPGALDRPKATFSRCADEAAQTGCRLRVISLTSEGEAGAAVPHRDGYDDTLPSIWRSRVVFQRRKRGARVAQLYLYDFTTRRLRHLRHGYVPAGATATGQATAIDLVGGVVAFAWASEPAALGVGPRTEIRAERTRDLTQAQAQPVGYISGACGGRNPRSPNATASGALFVDLRTPCGGADGFPATLSIGRRATSRGAAIPGLRRFARDAATGAVYAVVAGAGDTAQLARLGDLPPFVTGG